MERWRGRLVKPKTYLLLLAVLVFVAVVACAKATPTSTPRPTATPTPTATATPTPAPFATATPTAVPTATPTTVAPAKRPGKYGGVLKYGKDLNVEHLFFITVSGGDHSEWVYTVSDALFEFGPDSEYYQAKSLAESYDVSEDGQTITVHIRRGVKFHDGTDYNAHATKYNLDWVLDPENHVIWSAQISAIDRVTVIDDYTVELHTSRLFTPIITNLGLRSALAFSPTAFEEVGEDAFSTKPIGTGPFMVKEWVPGSHIRYERFDDYHMEGLPYLDAWEWREIDDERVRAAAMQTGELDFMRMIAGARDAIAAARAIPGIQEIKVFGGGPRLDHFNAARAPFDDKRVRCAFQMAVDREAWDEAVHDGEGSVYRGHLVPPDYAVAFMVPEEEFPYPYNPERARELIEEYAAEKGLTLPLDTVGAWDPTPEQVEKFAATPLVEKPMTIIGGSGRESVIRGELSKAWYEAIGIKAEVVIGAGDEAVHTFVTKDIGISLRGFGLRPHPSGTFDSYLGYGGYWNAGGYSTDPKQMEMDSYLKAASNTYDMAEQVRLYKEAQRVYMEECFGGVKLAIQPLYFFAQSWVKWSPPENKWVVFSSDACSKTAFVWLEK